MDIFKKNLYWPSFSLVWSKDSWSFFVVLTDRGHGVLWSVGLEDNFYMSSCQTKPIVRIPAFPPNVYTWGRFFEGDCVEKTSGQPEVWSSGPRTPLVRLYTHRPIVFEYPALDLRLTWGLLPTVPFKKTTSEEYIWLCPLSTCTLKGLSHVIVSLTFSSHAYVYLSSLLPFRLEIV